MMMSHATPFVVVVACFASLAQAQVVSFDTKRCQSGEFRQLGEAYVAFCDGYENGDAACTVWSGARKQSSDACLSGALMRSQMRIREEKSAPPVAKPAATAKAPDRPSPDVCRRTMLDKIGAARVDDVRPAVTARFQEIVVGTTPGSANMRLEARRSACDDPRVASVIYDFDGSLVLREVTYVWTRPPGPAPAPVFNERAVALGRLHGLPPPQSPSHAEGRSANVKIVLQDAPDRGALLEIYSSAN